MKRGLMAVAMTLAMAGTAKAQDMHFSQFWNAPTLFNPAATGDFNSDHRIFVQHRDQWRSVTVPYQTSGGSYDTRLFVKKKKKDHWGFGLNMFADKAGDSQLKSTVGNIAFGYHKKLTPGNRFSFGIQGGFRQHSINFMNAQWGTQYDGQAFNNNLESGETFYTESFTVADVAAGAQYAYIPHNMFEMKMGVAAYHLHKPRVNYSSIVRDRGYSKIIAHAESEIGIKNTNTSFIPHAMLMLQGPNQEFIIGSRVRYDFGPASKYTFWKKEPAVYFGGFYRAGDAVLLSFEMDWESLHIGMSYDLNVSGLTLASSGRGGFEASVRYITPFVSRHYGKRPRI